MIPFHEVLISLEEEMGVMIWFLLVPPSEMITFFVEMLTFLTRFQYLPVIICISKHTLLEDAERVKV